MPALSNRSRQQVLLALGLVAIAASLLVPRFGQDPQYHQFAGDTAWLFFPNAANVLSNLLFAWIGAEGLYRLLGQKSLCLQQGIHPAYFGFFMALVLIAAGSIYYHWSPDNNRLVWDRLPITFAFMSFFSVMLGERITPGLARRLFPLLLVAGCGSIVYWHYSELSGHGDLRPYALVQFLPVLLTPLMLLLLDARFSRSADIWWLLFWFVLAKACEALDHQIYAWLSLISGHNLKHVFASIGCLVFLRHLRLRRPLNP